MSLTVQQWQDEQTSRLQQQLDAAQAPITFADVTVSKPAIAFSRAASKALRVVRKLARQ